MSERPEREPTLRQDRLGAAYADPAVRTHTEALTVAGYSPATARSSALRSRESAGAQRAIQKHRAKQSDSARGIHAKSLAVVARELGKENPDPEYALKAVGVSALAIEKVPADEHAADEQEHADKVLYLKSRAFALGREWQRLHPTSTFEIPPRIGTVRVQSGRRTRIVEGVMLHDQDEDRDA